MGLVARRAVKLTARQAGQGYPWGAVAAIVALKVPPIQPGWEDDVTTTTTKDKLAGRATRGQARGLEPDAGVKPAEPTKGSETPGEASNGAQEAGNDPVSWVETHPHQHRESDYNEHKHGSTTDKAIATAHKKAMTPVVDKKAPVAPRTGRSRSRSTPDAQTQMDEVVLDLEENQGLYNHLQIRDANAKAHRDYATSNKKAGDILLGDKADKREMGLRDGNNHVLRLGEFRIVIAGATGEIKNITSSRRPVTKVNYSKV